MNSFFCPLDCGAKIKNFIKHFPKCKNKHLFGKEYLTCPYNSSHIFHCSLYKIHVDNCENKSEEPCSSSEDEMEKRAASSDEENNSNDKTTENKILKKTKNEKTFINPYYDTLEEVDEYSKAFFKKIYLN